jgi:hypothetical protein
MIQDDGFSRFFHAIQRVTFNDPVTLQATLFTLNYLLEEIHEDTSRITCPVPTSTILDMLDYFTDIPTVTEFVKLLASTEQVTSIMINIVFSLKECVRKYYYSITFSGSIVTNSLLVFDTTDNEHLLAHFAKIISNFRNISTHDDNIPGTRHM